MRVNWTGFNEMSKLAREFLRSRDGATAIEYAIMGSGIALVIVAAVGSVGTNLSASYANIANAFP
jgi:pilus assembly protein Flp/PilA